MQKYLKFHFDMYMKAYRYASHLQEEAVTSTSNTTSSTATMDIIHDNILKEPSLMRVADTVLRTDRKSVV